jgi:hypothetical protein
LVNTIYGRWWHPLDEKPGPNPVPGSPLPWTGDFLDGLGNKISMLAYANPPDIKDEKQRGDGYGIVRFNKKARTVTFECWPRFADARQGDGAQFPGWPVTVKMDDNDGRQPVAWLPELIIEGAPDAVVQVVAEATGGILYTLRTPGPRWQPPVFAPGRYTVKTGRDLPDGPILAGLTADPVSANAGQKTIRL